MFLFKVQKSRFFNVTFAVYSVHLWFCPCFILFCFVLSPIQPRSRTDLFCPIFQNNKCRDDRWRRGHVSWGWVPLVPLKMVRGAGAVMYCGKNSGQKWLATGSYHIAVLDGGASELRRLAARSKFLIQSQDSPVTWGPHGTSGGCPMYCGTKFWTKISGHLKAK